MSLSQRQLALLLIAPGARRSSRRCSSIRSASRVVSAFTDPDGGFALAGISARPSSSIPATSSSRSSSWSTSCALTALAAVAIAGTLTLGENPLARRHRCAALYRWPLFIPFIVAAQCMRTFLAKNGLMNNTFVSLGLMEPLQAVSFLDWRGIIITFVWKQTPFVALLLAGAHGLARPRDASRPARNLGASRLRILIELVAAAGDADAAGRRSSSPS